MSWNVLWLVDLSVGESRDNTSQVTETDVHGNSNTTLGGSSNVVSVPGDTHWDVGIDTASSKEGTGVLNSWLGGGDQHEESDDGKRAEEDHVLSTLLRSISEVTTNDSADTGSDVWRDGHELGVVGSVAHVGDDSWQEEGEGVEWGVDSDGDHHVNPNLPVHESNLEVLDVVLIGQSIAILVKTALDLNLLLSSQEGGTKE